MARDVVSELARLTQELKEIKRGQRYAHGGSLENSALEVKNTDGSLRAILGVQPDGTTGVNIVNGPPPPVPSMPTLAPSLGGVTVTWDGTFDGGAIPPMDWQRTEVHAHTSAGFTPSPATLQTTIETLQGGTVVVPTEQPVYVRLLARNTSGSASDPTAEAGPIGPSPVVATDIIDGIVTASKIAQGAVTINALTESLADTAGQRYVDAMGDQGAWTVLTAAPGAMWQFLTGVTDARTGSTVAEATGYTVVRGNMQVAYDPDVLYRISVRVRTTAASASGTDSLYAGVVGVAADGVTLVNRLGLDTFEASMYVAASNAAQPNGGGWVTYTGYMRGLAASGTAGIRPDPRTPGVAHTNTRFISPLLYLNYGSGTSGSTGTMQVDAFTIEALKTGVVDGTNLVSGSVTTAALAADSVTATAIAANAVTAGKILAGAVTAEKIDALAVTSDKVAANAITASKINAGAVTADKLEAVLQLVTRLVAGDPSGARVELNENGLRVYNAGGTQTIGFDAADGSGVFSGTITGSTITGGLIRTAATGERITINESGQNMVIVYDSTGAAVGELSARGLRLRGDSGALLYIDPDADYPNIRFFNPTNTNSAIINVVEGASGTANLAQYSGMFTGSGYEDMRWRTFLGNDLWVAERIRNSDANTRIGGRIFLSPTFANFAYENSADTTQNASLRVAPGEVRTFGALKNNSRTVPVPAAWTTLTPLSWVTTPAVTTYQSIRIRTDGTRAWLDGAASTGTAFTGSQNAFTIPAGMAPLKDHYYGVPRATSGDPRILGCRVQANGTIMMFASTTTTVATTDTYDFSAISWPLD
jgi:hypothetical protein